MRKLILLAAILAFAPLSWAVGTCTVSDATTTQNVNDRVPDANTVIVTVKCTADPTVGSYPAVTIPLTGYYPANTLLNAYDLFGYELYAVGRTPGATAPTANYTTTIKDVDGYGLDQALLTTNGSAASAQFTWMTSATAPYPVFPIVRSALTVQLSANSVDGAIITLDLIFRTNP